MQTRSRSAARLEPECGALCAGVALALVDLGLLVAGGARPLGPLWASAAVVDLGSALLFALAARLALRVTAALGPGRLRRSLAGAVLALGAIVPVSVLLFRGTGISTKPYAPYGPYLVSSLLFVLVAVGLRVAGHLARAARAGGPAAWACALASSLGAAALVWADRRLYPNQYFYLHWVLLGCTALALAATCWLLWARREPSRRRWIAPLLLAAGLLGCVPAALAGLQGQQERITFAAHTHAAGRLAGLYRALADWDGDHHSVVFGERDCDNLAPAIHPFAREVPENGIDEDCDGADARRPSVHPPRAHELDAEAYRALLRRWVAEPGPARALARTAQHNVVLIILDALRADEVQPGSGAAAQHGRLSALLGAGRHFLRCFALGAGTDIGMATLLTGQLDPFARGNPTLLEQFQRAGFTTWGVFQREVERWVGRQLQLKGLSGRRVVVNDPGRRDVGTQATSRQVTDAGIRFLDKLPPGARFFLWLHYFDIHEHHQIDPATLGEDRPRGAPPERGRPFYRLMVQHTERHVQRLVDALRERGLLERTIVVLVSDHGEGLAESPRLPMNHGDVLFNPLVHVPLAFLVPGERGRTITTPVTLADVFPTLLDLAGIERPPSWGLSLAPFLLDPLPRELAAPLVRPLFLVEVRQRGVILWPHKLLAWQDQGLVELYDLERDYQEQRNLADDAPQVAARLAQVLAAQALPSINRLPGAMTR